MPASQQRYPTTVSHPRLRDADFSYTFKVEYALDVQGSTVGDTHHCAAARCLQRQPGIVDAWVMKTRTFIIFSDGDVYRFHNPQRLEDMVRKFDGTAGLFPPGDYMVVPISPGESTGARKKYKNASKTKASKDRNHPDRKRHHSYRFR